MSSPKASQYGTNAMSETKPLGSPKASGIPQLTKRKTVVTTEGGTKKLVNTNDLVKAQALDEHPKLSARRGKSKDQCCRDIFGDFFGFGSNPPGVMSKGAAPVNVKGEKEKFIKALKEEAKQFDLETIKNDLNKKIDQIAVGIKKEEKKLIVTEEKQLRNLDKLTYMAEYLEEDNQKTT